MIRKNLCYVRECFEIDDLRFTVNVSYHMPKTGKHFIFKITFECRTPSKWTADFFLDDFAYELPGVLPLRKMFLEKAKRQRIKEKKQLLNNEKLPFIIHKYLSEIFDKMEISVKDVGL